MIDDARRRILAVVALAFLLLVGGGCAAHRASLDAVTAALRRGDATAALATYESSRRDQGDLLFQMEHGHLLHIAGRWEESNAAFEEAERIARELYTKSISREAVALLTTDLALPYRGMPYELQLIHYYRALNYLELRKTDDALVEARKANLELSQYASGEEDTALRQDAFLQYFTGLLYASAGEWNDALVSYRTARELYGKYEEEYALPVPGCLERDLARTSNRIAIASERNGQDDVAPNVILFLESGYVPFRTSVELNFPVFEDGGGEAWDRAGRYFDRYGADPYRYAYREPSVHHVLRVAFPRLVELPPEVRSIEVVAAAGDTVRSIQALDLARVAWAEFNARRPAMLLRTVARALAKEVARASADREAHGLGVLVNILGAASEQADTRGWVLLPGRIDLVQVHLPPGRANLSIRFRSASGSLLEERRLEFDVPARGSFFAAVRCFR
ncbi:MAG: hypothetical protein U0527_11365 [Candidatus Eisenbacteria bacterium]